MMGSMLLRQFWRLMNEGHGLRERAENLFLIELPALLGLRGSRVYCRRDTLSRTPITRDDMESLMDYALSER